MKFPGLVKECEVVATELKILDELQNEDIKYIQFKTLIKNKIKLHNEKILKTEMMSCSKLEKIMDETYEQKNYMKDMKIEEIRTMFGPN